MGENSSINGIAQLLEAEERCAQALAALGAERARLERALESLEIEK